MQPYFEKEFLGHTKFITNLFSKQYYVLSTILIYYKTKLWMNCLFNKFHSHKLFVPDNKQKTNNILRGYFVFLIITPSQSVVNGTK